MKLPTVVMTGPGGDFRVNKSDQEAYEAKGFTLNESFKEGDDDSDAESSGDGGAATRKKSKKSASKAASNEDLEIKEGSTVTVDFDGEPFTGTVKKISKRAKTAEVAFEDDTTEKIDFADITVTANPS